LIRLDFGFSNFDIRISNLTLSGIFFTTLFSMRIKLNRPYRFERTDRLWRYIDLHQLLYFINTESIFFAPLSSFDDPLEGISEKHLQGGSLNAIKRNSLTNWLQRLQPYIHASCWFLGDTESMAMWQTHSNPDSVALEFRANDLVRLVLTEARKLKPGKFLALYHGKVDYIKISPVDRKSLRKANQQVMGFLKDKSYKHEEEFRFIVTQSKRTKQTFPGFDLPVGPLRDIDFNIITHPQMESWKHDNLKTVLRNFGLQEKLRWSAIIKKR
jgi:hypothetical protein